MALLHRVPTLVLVAVCAVATHAAEDVPAAVPVTRGYTVSTATALLANAPDDATVLALGTTDGVARSTTIALPFPFHAFGEPATTLLVSVNGYVIPDGPTPLDGDADPATRSFPFVGGDAAGDGVIAPCWAPPDDDAVRVRTWTDGAAPLRRFVVTWEHGAASSPSRLVQVQLFEGPGRIVFAYSVAAVTGDVDRPYALAGLDERGGDRCALPPSGQVVRVGATTSDLVFTPRCAVFAPTGVGKESVPVRWQDVRKEATIPDGCTRRIPYLAKGRHLFHVRDRARFVFDDHGRHPRDAADLARLRDEDRDTFGGKGDPLRFVRQVLDGKILLLPADGGAPVRVWFRIVEYFSLDDTGSTAFDNHTWNLRWMLSRAFPKDDPRREVDRYFAWKATAAGRLSVGKLFDARRTSDADTQYDSGRGREYVLWSSRIRPGPRGALAPLETPGEGWARFTLEEDDLDVPQRGDDASVRFVADPHYVDGHYGYTVAADDNPFGWMTARTVPAPPLRDEGVETDPGAPTTPVTPR